MECPIKKWAQAAPQRAALSYRNTTYSYAALNRHIDTLARRYAPKTIYPIEQIDVPILFAIFRSGGSPFPINARLPERQKRELIETFSGVPIPIRSATALMTSGSTNTPKIACTRFLNYCLSAQRSYSVLGMDETSKMLLSLPLFHVSGITALFRAFTSGAHVIVPQSKDLESECVEQKITHLSAVPTQLQSLSHVPQPLTILLGGAPTSSELLQGVAHHTLFHSYGMTETTAMIFCNGKPLGNTTFRIEKDARLLVKTDTLFQGYFEKNRLIPPLLKDGFFDTGDQASVQEDGTIHILGRSDRMFISGGENIQPSEIEKILESHSLIDIAIVRSKKDTRYGAVPIAYIHPYISRESLLQFLLSALPKYKIPQEIHPLSKLGGKYEINFS